MNNWKDTVLVDEIDCKYIIYGKEVGENGTPHLQGTIVFANAKSISSVFKKLPGCHIEICAAPQKSFEYCKKDGDFTERGDKPMSAAAKGEAEQERWMGYLVSARAGDFEDIPAKIQFQNPHLLTHHRNEYLQTRKLQDTTQQHLWYWGESGTGKSRKAREEYPDAYLKNANKWWCGYVDDPVVIIEDFDERHEMLAHYIKIWGDRFPFQAETKGSSFKIRPGLIIVTSNYHPTDIWTKQTDLEPILRRFKTIEFKKLSEKLGAPSAKSGHGASHVLSGGAGRSKYSIAKLTAQINFRAKKASV